MPGSVVDLDELGAVDEARDTGCDSSMVLFRVSSLLSKVEQHGT